MKLLRSLNVGNISPSFMAFLLIFRKILSIVFVQNDQMHLMSRDEFLGLCSNANHQKNPEADGASEMVSIGDPISQKNSTSGFT